MSVNIAREPSGTPSGGRFAAGRRREPAVKLDVDGQLTGQSELFDHAPATPEAASIKRVRALSSLAVAHTRAPDRSTQLAARQGVAAALPHLSRESATVALTELAGARPKDREALARVWVHRDGEKADLMTPSEAAGVARNSRLTALANLPAPEQVSPETTRDALRGAIPNTATEDAYDDYLHYWRVRRVGEEQENTHEASRVLEDMVTRDQHEALSGQPNQTLSSA